jgi:tRNA pseudouridine13 synthase
VLQVSASGGLFVCEDPHVDQARCDRREVVVTGPMFGVKMKQPLHEPLAREQKVLKTSGITAEMWDSWKSLAPGARRAFVVHLSELSLAQRAPDSIALSFALPSGAYATSVLREFARTEVDAEVDRCSS